MGSLASTQARGVSLGAVGRRKLRALAAALELSDELTLQALEVFGLMSASWADWAVGDSPAWPNDISDDGTPFEFSASFDGASPRLRMLVESQAEPVSRLSTWSAGIALGQRLKAAGYADLTLFEQVRDLFAPHSGAQGRFSLWHAAVVEQGQPPLFKAYLNPCLFGIGSARYVVEQALLRLGFAGAWQFLEERLASDPAAEIRYFSVDLAAPEVARVKLYLACSQSASAVESLIAPASNSEPEDARRWLDALTASEGPFDARPILNCFSFRRGLARPDVTVHVPIRCYVKHDAEALARVSTLLTSSDAKRLSRALTAVSDRPLSVGRGLLTYASLRREAGAVRVTVYMAPEAYSITSRRPSAPPTSGFSSGVHKTSSNAASATRAHMGDAQALVTRQSELLRAQPLLGHLAGQGTVAEAQRLVEHLSLLVLWLGDLFRFAEEGATNADVRPHLTQQAVWQAARARQFRADLENLGLSLTSLPLYTDEHTLIREVAFARVADVLAAEEDCVRLGMALSVSATTDDLLKAGLAFAARAVIDRAPVSTLDAARQAASAPTQASPRLSRLTLSDLVARDVYAAVDRCFESLLRVVTAIDRVTFGA
jgi:DMATS type aromatic prenyltransferase